MKTTTILAAMAMTLACANAYAVHTKTIAELRAGTTSEAKDAAKAWARHGIVQYRLLSTEQPYRARLIDADARTVAELSVAMMADIKTIRLIGLAGFADVELALGQGGIQLRIPDAGVDAQVSFDWLTKMWTPHGASPAAMDAHREIIVVMLSIASDIEQYVRPLTQRTEKKSDCDEVTDAKRGACCSGSQMRGTTYGSSARSQCCAAATDEANGQCSNSLCYGCCYFYNCDAYCYWGDYGCYCGRTGVSCSYCP